MPFLEGLFIFKESVTCRRGFIIRAVDKLNVADNTATL